MKIRITFLIIIVLFSVTKLFAQNSFDGHWQISTAKSDFGKAPAFTMPTAMNLHQKNDSLFVEFKGTDHNGQTYTAGAEYKLDGTMVERTTPQGGKLKAFMKWTNDQAGLIKNQKYFSGDTVENPYRTVIETWTLSKDGTLTVQHSTQNFDKPESNYTIKAVYQKE